MALLIAYYLFFNVSEIGGELGSRASGQSWILGLLVPTLLVGHGIYAFGKETLMLADDYAVEGSTAIVFALALTCAGMALHFHFLWRGSPKLWRLSEIGKFISILLPVIFMGRGFHLFILG